MVESKIICSNRNGKVSPISLMAFIKVNCLSICNGCRHYIHPYWLLHWPSKWFDPDLLPHGYLLDSPRHHRFNFITYKWDFPPPVASLVLATQHPANIIIVCACPYPWPFFIPVQVCSVRGRCFTWSFQPKSYEDPHGVMSEIVSTYHRERFASENMLKCETKRKAPQENRTIKMSNTLPFCAQRTPNSSRIPRHALPCLGRLENANMDRPMTTKTMTSWKLSDVVSISSAPRSPMLCGGGGGGVHTHARWEIHLSKTIKSAHGN